MNEWLVNCFFLIAIFLKFLLMVSWIGTQHHGLVWLVGIKNNLLEGNWCRTMGTDLSWLGNRQHDIMPPSKYGENLEKNFERDEVRVNISF